MADIAFLLLIFFLATTTISPEVGISRQLPSPCPDIKDCTKTISERNMLRIQLNTHDDILINDQLITVQELKPLLVEFIDNNGDASCDYCKGSQNLLASDNPKEAVIIIAHNKQTNYKAFINVQNEITKAIMHLREAYSQSYYKRSYSDLSPLELKIVQKAYPINISETIL
jgi:biopolymer transport protein ExbD